MFRPTRASSDCGFTLLETLVALIVLVVGVVATADLAANLMNTSRQSKYMSLAAELAAEKLEDLSRWDPDDPQICVPAGSSSVGSLTTDVLQTTTCPPPLSQCAQTTGRSAPNVNYYDDVYMATVNSTNCPNTTYGCFTETVSSPDNGALILTTTHASGRNHQGPYRSYDALPHVSPTLDY